MKILIIDQGLAGLHFGMRCQQWGHTVKIYIPPKAGGSDTCVAKGMLDRVDDWRPLIDWADLTVCTDNNKYAGDLEEFYGAGYPIIGANRRSAELELNREVGQRVLSDFGIQVADHQIFSNCKKAIRYVKEFPDKIFVSKPWGGAADKALSYVSKSAADMIYMLEYWDANDLLGSGEFMLQECIKGVEMAVGGWFGPGGWNRAINENWEEKRYMNEGLGENCFSEDTEVLTQRGWKTFDKVTLDDLVASYNPKTKETFFERPVKLHWTPYSGDMIEFKNRYVDLLVTPTHNMWAARRKTNDWRVYPAYECPSEFNILQVGKTSARDLPPIKLSSGLVIPADSWMWFLGLYLSEGYTDIDRPRITICQNPGPNQDIMFRSLSSMGLPWYINGNKIIVTDKALSDYTRQFGLSRDKYIPEELMTASARQIDIFLTAFNLGDGDFHNNRRRYTSGSYELISGIQALLHLIGRTGVISTDNRTTMISPTNGNTYVANPVYSLEESGRDIVSVRERRTVQYTGMIGCVTLPTTHLLVVRRNNRVAVCHNTGEMGTIMRYVDRSPLFDAVLDPVTDYLFGTQYCGYVDQNCIIDTKGQPWPLEFTMRFGWPHFNIAMQLHKGDPVEWLYNLRFGKDTLQTRRDVVACGVVMHRPRCKTDHAPIYGLTPRLVKDIALVGVCLDKAPVMVDGSIEVESVECTTDEYVLVALGTGDSVTEAHDRATEIAWKINWPGHRAFRTDIGMRLESDLKELQKHGFARGMHFK